MKQENIYGHAKLRRAYDLIGMRDDPPFSLGAHFEPFWVLWFDVYMQSDMQKGWCQKSRLKLAMLLESRWSLQNLMDDP